MTTTHARHPHFPSRAMHAAAVSSAKTIRGVSVARVALKNARAHARSRVVDVRAAKKEIIATDKSPAALGPYSQAVKVGNTVYVSGQIGLTPAMEFAGSTVEEQTEQVMKNMGEVLNAAGATFDDVVKCTIMIANMDDFKTVNGIYGSRFPGENPPARATLAAKSLPLGALVEIDAVAVIG